MICLDEKGYHEGLAKKGRRAYLCWQYWIYGRISPVLPGVLRVTEESSKGRSLNLNGYVSPGKVTDLARAKALPVKSMYLPLILI